MEKKEKIKQSEQVVIKRSMIRFAPYNPKRHTDDDVKKQVRNFRKIGYLGGVIWNEVTGNLVSGHKRVMAMDIVFGNTTDHPVEYDVRLEKVHLTEKQEMEQNIYMDARSTNTEQAFDLIAPLMNVIDVKEAGLDDTTVDLIIAENPDMDFGKSKEFKEDFEKIEKSYEEKKKKIKEMKKQIKEGIFKEQGSPFVTLSFESYENKAQFMEAMGYDSEFTIIKGEAFFDKLNGNG